MNDDIKEKMTIGKAKKILRGFLAKDCYYDTPLYYAIPYLLDYITNLQQAFENSYTEEQLDFAVNEVKEQLKAEHQLTNQLHNEIDKLRVKNYELQQEIRKLKEKIKHYEETVTFSDYVKEVNLLVDYKLRIEKAVEYIHKNYFEVVYKTKGTMGNDLLNILNG